MYCIIIKIIKKDLKLNNGKRNLINYDMYHGRILF